MDRMSRINRRFMARSAACLRSISRIFPTHFRLHPLSAHFMKTTCLILLSLAFSVGAQELQVVERGPHHQVLKRITSWVGPNGTTYYRTNRFTELANGLCYLPEGPNAQWELTREEFQAFENGFVANQAPMRVILSANVNAPNAIDAITSDGQRFEISPFILAMRDGTGQSVLIAQIQDSGGRLIAPNTVLYDQAFPGAAIRVTLTRDGVEQDCVIFDDTDFHPEDYNLNPNTTTIELWSEFITAPESTVTPVFEGEVATDVVVDFGSSRIAAGKAFAADNQDVSIPVRKAYGVIQNRRFLVEKVDYQKVKPFLDNLNPNGAKVGNSDRAARVAQRKVVKDEKELLAQVTAKPRTRRSASLGKPSSTQLMAFDWKRNPGVVIDFQLFNTTSLTSMTFQGDTTYHIAGTVTLSGTTVFEAGAVLKYSNAARVKVTGPVDWRGSTWRPVVFTAIDDVSVGDTVRTNTLTGQYASVALDFDANTAAADFVLQNLRISHATNAIRILGRSGHSISHAQFLNCANAITLTNATSAVRNGLFYNFGTSFTGSNSTARCEQLTLDAGTALNGNASFLVITLTNSLLTAVTSSTGYTNGNQVNILSSASGVYQTVGAGAHYLAAGSPYRTGGATTINTQLAAQLRKLTTYPPVVLSPSSLMGGTVNYTRTVPRATSGNAIGYHYDPIDYAASGVYAVSGTTVTIQPGVVFAGYQASPSVNYIMGFDYGAKLQATGTPDLPCEFIWYNSVQEQANTAWQGEVSVLVWRGTFYSSAPSAELSFRFTDWILLGTDAFAHISGAEDTSALPTVVRDSSFHGGTLWLVGSKFNVTNCLLDRVATTVWLDPTDSGRRANFRGSQFYGGNLASYDAGSNLMTVRDCVFYQTFVAPGDDTWDHGWNGFYTNGCSTCTVLSSPKGTNVIGSISFLSGPLGTFYQPTSSPLINVGTTNANLIALYHSTTTTNQVKETNTMVDIGLHYPSTSGLTSNLPLDSDGDGIADLFEDANSNGTLDSGETDASAYNSRFGIGSPAPGLVVFTLMK